MTTPMVEQLHALIKTNLQGEAQGVLKKYLEEADRAIALMPVLDERITELQKTSSDKGCEIQKINEQLKEYRRRESEIAEKEKNLSDRDIALRVDIARLEGSEKLYAGTTDILTKMLSNRVVRETVQQGVSIPVVQKMYQTEYDGNGNPRTVQSGEFVEDHEKTETTETNREEG